MKSVFREQSSRKQSFREQQTTRAGGLEERRQLSV
jgi:hypothetical protein